MADESEPKTLDERDWKLIAAFVKDEQERRAGAKRRRELEAVWAEIDRQLSMEARARGAPASGQVSDWYPAVELPLQYTALEVIAADARRLKFPRGSDWYSVVANLSDDYLARWEKRRQTKPIIGDRPDPMALDQETADTLVKAVIEHFHRLYDFRAAIDLFDADMIKYGTGAVRVRSVRIPKIANTYRGLDTIQGPAVIPCSIRSTYLDDTPAAVMLEGYRTGPLHIRRYFQRLNDLKAAAEKGGADLGWMASEVAKMKPLRDDVMRGHVEMLEAEGDVIVGRNGAEESIFLPNVQMLVAVGNNGPFVVRFRKNQTPFNSYVIGHYMRDDLQSPYGSSPLMRGQPVQEAATSVLNDLLATSLLMAQPPVVYDGNDARLAANGGPSLYPGAQFGMDDVDSLKSIAVGDLTGVTSAYLGLLKQYEDVTGVNDPRRGAQVNSHTTATAIDIEATRGQSRTDDFVQGVEQGALTTILHMEYTLAREAIKTPMDIAVSAGGISGWVKVGAQDLADDVAFAVHGSAGVLNEKERAQNFIAANTQVLQIAAAGMQMGSPMGLDLEEMARKTYELFGITDAGKIVGGAREVPPGLALAANVQGAAASLPPGHLAQMGAQQGDESGPGPAAE